MTSKENTDQLKGTNEKIVHVENMNLLLSVIVGVGVSMVGSTLVARSDLSPIETLVGYMLAGYIGYESFRDMDEIATGNESTFLSLYSRLFDRFSQQQDHANHVGVLRPGL